MSKQISIQRHERGVRIDSEVAHTSSPNNFFNSTQVKDKLSLAKQAIRKGNFIPSDIKLLTAYTATILLYKNCQRSGVIENLTIEECKLRWELTSNTVLPCVHYKTGSTNPAAKLVVNNDNFKYILDYYYLIWTNHFFFLTHNGSKYTQVYRKIKEAIKVNDIEVEVPPAPSAYQIKVTTSLKTTTSDGKWTSTYLIGAEQLNNFTSLLMTVMLLQHTTK